ncbi:MAG: hypothetical protein LQ338_006007 [Usnochroma carphineum]|nr:MAG: hypothetical protein LQ338_006007 [Usnochroma carphineum]
MHKPPLAPVVYSWLFPNPKPTDPPNFQTCISKQLVPEVRAETARFYGHIDCVEAQYPGLDYATPAHRLRLSRFPYHRRLFHVFDHLRLTNHEIQTLCKWEGTRWARERYERDVGIRVRETTWDDVMLATPEPPTVTRTQLRGGAKRLASTPYVQRQEYKNDLDIPTGNIQHQHSSAEEEMEEDAEEESSDDEADNMEQEAEDSEDELQQSVGVELNQRLMAATEARNRGEEAVLDADWEQWLKEAAERGAIPGMTVANAGHSSAGPSPAWTPQLPGAFETSPARLSLPASFSLPATANPSLDGTSAPPAGTAM